MADDSDVSLPRTTLQKMIKDLVPPDMRVANDTVDLVIACCTEFIQLLSSESNEVATRESRSIIHPDHVLRALSELGFPGFVGEVTAAWDTFKEETKTAHSRKADLRKTGAEHAGMSEEEQIFLQQQMFAQARAQSMTTSESAAAMHAAYEQALAAQQHQAGATYHHHHHPLAIMGQPSDGFMMQQQMKQMQRQSDAAGASGGGAGGESGGLDMDDDYSE